MENNALPTTPLRDEWVCSECFMRLPRTRVLLRDRTEQPQQTDRRLQRHLRRLYGPDAPEASTRHPLLDWRLLPDTLVTMRHGEPHWRSRGKTQSWSVRACPVCHSEARHLLMGQQPVCVEANGTELLKTLRGLPVQPATVRDLTGKWPEFEQKKWHRQYTGWCEHWVRKVQQNCQWLVLPRRMPHADPVYLAELQGSRVRQAGGFLLLLEPEAVPQQEAFAPDRDACAVLQRLQRDCVDLPRLRRVPAAAVILLPPGEQPQHWQMRHPKLAHLLQDTFAQPVLLPVTAGQPEQCAQGIALALDRLAGLSDEE